MLLPIFSRQLWLPGSTKSTFRFEGGVREFLGAGGWSIDANITRKKALILLHAPDEFADASITDGIRLATAAFESAVSVNARTSDPRECAWQFVSYYYAAYFSANALMRLCGFGCTNITSLECAEINEYARLCGFGGVGEQNKIAPGVFYSWVDQNSTPVWNMHLINAKGGVHIQFWCGFMKFLLKIKESIDSSAMPKADRDSAKLELTDLILGLKHSGSDSGAWLSEVRNALNYRLEYGVWFPYANCQIDGLAGKQALASAFNGGLNPPKQNMQIPDLERATRITGYLLAWLHESLLTLESSSARKKKDLIKNGPIALALRI